MEYVDLTTLYCFTPLWIANTFLFGYQAYRSFKELKKENNANIFPLIFWSTATTTASILTGFSAVNGLEKLIE